MPNRVLRDWTDSKRVDGVSFEAEVLFNRIIMKMDDFGNFYRDCAVVKSLAFPRKATLTAEQVDGWLLELESADLIRCYRAKGDTFLHVVKHGQRLDRSRRAFPKEPEGFDSREDDEDEYVDNHPPQSAAVRRNPPRSAAIRREPPPETKGNETNLKRNESSETHSLSVKKYDLEFFGEQGRIWELPDELYASLNKFLNYRSSHPDFGPIKSADQVEGIIREFFIRRIPPEDAVKMIDRTIARGAKNIIYELEKQSNGNGDKTIRKGQPDIARADELADKILQEHFNRSDSGGNQF